MCTNMHMIYNKYIHKRVLVSCGKCEACRQQKADARAFRIKHSTPAGWVQLFVTLTYNNDSLPVVRKDEIKENSFVSVMRVNQATMETKDIGMVYVDSLPYGFNASLTPTPRNYTNYSFLGVCFYKDIQDFFKRLRVNLQRHYNYNGTFKYYACSEYGETYFRPHYHLAIGVPSDSVEIFRSCICKSWSFADYDRTFRNIEIARHCGDYVASYVNCDSSLPKILQIPAFRQKHSYSQGYGMDFNAFSLPYILEKAKSCSLVYNKPNTTGATESDSVCIPKYVINRFFPQIKGYSSLPPAEVYRFLLRPTSISEFFNKKYLRGEKTEYKRFTTEDVIATTKRLSNAAQRYINTLAEFGIQRNYFDYIIDYESVWRSYYATQLKQFYKAQKDDIFNPPATYYDNINDICTGIIHCDYDRYLSPVAPLNNFENYNALPSRVELTRNSKNRYQRKVKQRKVTNLIMHQFHDDI